MPPRRPFAVGAAPKKREGAPARGLSLAGVPNARNAQRDGWFPASYVQLKATGRSTPDPVTVPSDPDKEATRAHSASNTPVPLDKATSPSGGEGAVDASKERVVALFAYTAQHSDELSFKKDDIITILERGADPDWWKGELDGRSGLFPANYIRALTTSD